MPPIGFEPTISAAERPKTYALDRAATGTGKWHFYLLQITVITRTKSLACQCLTLYGVYGETVRERWMQNVPKKDVVV
jgi:hypothetical protein